MRIMKFEFELLLAKLNQWSMELGWGRDLTIDLCRFLSIRADKDKKGNWIFNRKQYRLLRNLCKQLEENLDWFINFVDDIKWYNQRNFF